ncbi:MAG: hypothetical protein KAS30_03530, partial [Candidatus Diapherotrites archaeon]|nr:hypothetical protein [Candidatus Diapherotrites archaeon]
MAKQVKNTDLIEKGIFTPSIKSADELTASLDKLDAGFMKVIKTAKKGLKGTKLVDLADVEKASKAIKDVDSAAKGLTATQKERVKLKEKLKQQNSTEIQQNIQLKRQIQEQAKANKDLEIIQSKNAGTLQKLAAQSRILRRERDRLNLDTEKGRKRLQEINKELDKNNKK